MCESWSRNGEGIKSCTIGVNDFLQEIHHRMPVILAPEVYDLWLDPEVRAPDQSNNETGCIERAARTKDAVYSRRL